MRSDRHHAPTTPHLATLIASSVRAGAAGALLLASPWARPAHAQTSHFLACTPGALANCTEVLLTSTLGAGTGGTTLFEIALRNAGSTAQPSLATSVYNLVFATGLPTVAPGAEVSGPVAPVAVGGATLADPSGWDLFEDGSSIFLSALTDDGVGGCVMGGPLGGFGQAGNTCGAGQFLTFSFSTPRIFDPRTFHLLDMEVVGLAATLPGDSCGTRPACVITPLGTGITPEPTAAALLASGLVLLLAGAGARRRVVAGGGASDVRADGVGAA